MLNPALSATAKFEMLPNCVRIILIRHGQSTFNALKRFQGSCDQSVLTEKGDSDALQTGFVLRDIPFDAVYVSPLQRAKATANSFLVGTGARITSTPTIQYSQALREIDLPQWQGLSYQEVKENFAEDYRIWKEQPHQFKVSVPSEALQASGGLAIAPALQTTYPVLDLQERVREFWQNVLPRHTGHAITIVSHGGTIRALIMELLGISSQQFHALQQSNCGISHLLAFPDKNTAILQQMNNTFHLGETLPKLKEGKQGLRLLLVAAEPNTQAQALAQHLQSVNIDFCLSSDAEASQQVAHEILQGHSTVQLQVTHQNFADVWQQQINARQSTQSLSHLRPTTGLVVGDTALIRQMVAHTLKLSKAQQDCLAIDPSRFSVIHYPLSSPTPILQAFNFG